MARNWTDAQKTAIEARDRTLLISAAAGSGKTAVLTERIIRMLTDPEHPMDISRMLVVTFTRAAAGELRARIAKALSDAIALSPQKEHLSRQLMLLSGASISTIDSFYYDLVRANFQQAGFSASIRLADETELLSLRRELMNDVVDEMYTQNEDFSLVSDTLCDMRSEGGLTDTLLSIYSKLLRYPEALDILTRSADRMETTSDPLDSPWGVIWCEEVRRLCRTGQRLFADALDMAAAEPNADKLVKRYQAHFNEHLDRHRAILEYLDSGNYDKAREAIAAPFVIRKPGGKCPERTPAFIDAMALCDFFREKWKEKHAERLSAFSAEEVAQSGTESARVLRLLHTTLTRFESLYRAAKLQREIAEFSDVSRAAYKLLVDKDGNATALAADVRTKYDAIFIDEYQDVDSMQDATFRAISTENNRFMVGDIKQSIYRFRGAQPKVFADYRRRFKSIGSTAPGDPASIFMSNCFRCDKSVIDFSNAVSGDLFSQNAESIGYSKEDDLVYSKDPAFAKDAGQKCRVVLINRAKFDELAADDEETDKASKTEAIWIASEIARLLYSGKKADGTPITPGDIAVLMRNTAPAEHIARYLGELGIPCNDTSRKSFFENPDVLCVYSLLAALDNPYRDVYMAAALRSPFFGFTLEDLVRLHAANAGELSLFEAVTNAAKTATGDSALDKRLQDFSERFPLWREKARALPVDRLLRYLYRESAILSFAGCEDDAGIPPVARRANLQRLYEYARTFEQSSFKGLYQFVRYVDGIMESGGKMPAPDGEEDAVSLITIHHSKGLEFPVCFIAGTATRFNTKELSDHFLDEEELGCAIRLPNAGPFSRANTFQREAIALRLRDFAIEEEMRVLYVAMTRAKERLYVTADSPYGAKHLLDRATLAATKGGEFVCKQGPAYIYWILSALMRTNHAPFATIETVQEADVVIGHIKAQGTVFHEEEELVSNDERLEALKERFSFRYPMQHLTNLPAKLSVSKLSPGVLDVYDTDAVAPSEINEADIERLLHNFSLTPTFLSPTQEKSAAARGTATHEFLQFCDFAKVEKDGVAKELERLIAEKFLSPDTRDLVRTKELERFFESSFYSSLRGAVRMRRETRFHIFLPAADFTRKTHLAYELGEEKLAVQGVIDLFYYDAQGKLILCDYKTDRLTAEELKDPCLAAQKLSERHGEQLSYYARALEEICGKRPDKTLIYSLPLGEAVEVKI